MKRENLDRTVQKLIAAGKTQQVFTFLGEQFLSAQQSATLALIEAEFNNLQKSTLKGLLSYQEQQLQKNRINNQLLSLFQDGTTSTTSSKSTSKFFKIVVGVLFLGISGLFILWFGSIKQNCPTYPEEVRNKILILPFEKVAGATTQPELVLRDRINQLTLQHQLSTQAELGSAATINFRTAPPLAIKCKATVLIWGTYTASSDSVRLNLHYSFTNPLPKHSSIEEMVIVKDAMDLLQQGNILKSQDDAILALCGIVAIRDGKKDIAQKWFQKMEDIEEVDREILEVLSE